MKITSKSILSPSHHPRDAAGPVCLSTSLSRRLKTNRSLKGAQSPMFPSGGKKRGSAFDNPEPSSPKVTCIGQVRVKTKKKQGKKKIRTGEVSFRNIEGGNPNQRWVHFPLTICEALRGFGAEFSCLLPCRPSCFSTGEREKEGKESELVEGNGGSSCVAVFGRWLVGVQGREIELVGGDEEERGTETREGNLRRDMVEEREIKDEQCEVSEDCGVVEEEGGRVSICVPPKNALLLMRCRSDPIRVSALVNRFWESPARNAEQEEEEGDEDVVDPERLTDDAERLTDDAERLTEDEEVEVFRKLVSTPDDDEEENPEAEVQDSVMEVQEEAEERENPEEKLENSDEVEEEDDELEPVVVQEVKLLAETGENEVSCSVSEALSDLQRFDNEENVENPVVVYQPTEPREEEIMCSDEPFFDDSGLRRMFLEEEEEEVAMGEETEEKSMGEKVTQETSESDETQRESEPIETEEREKVERETEMKKEQNRERSSSVLPECLLLMMCEPKLSMEVSKETWVCSTDFVRWQPERKPVKKTDGGDGPRKRISSIESNPAPAAVSMAALIEQKLVNAVAYEPFVLTRCKSEPMRTAAAKLAPESCFWKNRKLDPLRRATFGVGAAGIGF